MPLVQTGEAMSDYSEYVKKSQALRPHPMVEALAEKL